MQNVWLEYQIQSESDMDTYVLDIYNHQFWDRYLESRKNSTTL